MKKSKKIILLGTIIPILGFPIISSSCNLDINDFNEKSVPLLTESQKQTIVENFSFTLKDEGKQLYLNNQLKNKWDEFVNGWHNKQEQADFIINHNSDFNKYFDFKYHSLSGFGSAHKYNFKLSYTGLGIPSIEYRILCVDRNDEEEARGFIKLEIG